MTLTSDRFGDVVVLVFVVLSVALVVAFAVDTWMDVRCRELGYPGGSLTSALQLVCTGQRGPVQVTPYRDAKEGR